MEQMQHGTIKIGQIVKLFSDSIGMDALLSNVNEKARATKIIQRLIEEKESKIDNLREFETLIKNFCNESLKSNYINKAQTYVIQTLYFDMLALITKTNPYNNPTQNEVELQVMYCIALTFREIYDDIAKRKNNPPGEILQEALWLFDFWKPTIHEKNITLIPSCFDFIFSEITNDKVDLITYWEECKDKIVEDKESEKSTDYTKTINDWMLQKTKPKWNNLKPIIGSDIPDKIQFKEYTANYTIFKTNLFSAYFFTNFFNSLEEQKLVSTEFKDTVQNGIRWFCRYAFEKNGDFTKYEWHEVQNPMFSLMRFLVHPSDKNRSLVSEYIYEAFDKENGMAPDIKSLYYIPLDKIYFPVLSYDILNDDLKRYQIIYETFNELSTDPELGIYKNKIIQEKEIDDILNWTIMGECKNFYYNWFKGKYLVLCHEFESGLNYYKKAFENKYYGGKALPYFLEEIIVLMKKCKAGKVEQNHIYEWANALRFYIYESDKDDKTRIDIRTTFEEVFPEEAFIK